ncbi:MAG: hypothetical protein SPE49_08760 [Campylobacter sp.]|uniref:hypothetical protein n=1 Tax=Campylobacter sp. TaxID=205 RepID=UPI002A81FB42|nr:hypothetical protein [Campylobacter sp.]MDY5116037.1 hypothetical protein [Campylobacter sp.]
MAIRLARLLRLNFTHTSLGRSTSATSLVFAQFSHTRRTILELPFSREFLVIFWALFYAHSLRSPARSGKTFAAFYCCCLVKSARNFASCYKHGSSVSLRAQKISAQSLSLFDAKRLK